MHFGVSVGWDAFLGFEYCGEIVGIGEPATHGYLGHGKLGVNQHFFRIHYSDLRDIK